MADLIFDHPRIQVWHGRWQDIGLQPDSIDVVLTDPPYDAHTQNNVRSCNTTGKVKVKTYDLAFEPLADMSHVPALLEVAKQWVICFSSLELIGDYLRAAGGHRKAGGGYVRGGIWRKQQAAPQLSGDRPANSCESFVVMHPPGGKMKWNGSGKHAYLTCAEGDEAVPAFCVPDFIESGRERAEKRHPAQKPAQLCARLAEWFVNDNDLVLDPYAGSGALGFAAFDRGASVILVDQDPEWAIFCAERAQEMTTSLACAPATANINI
jgi:16S rRNA G966 N2-methylase RsmD